MPLGTVPRQKAECASMQASCEGMVRRIPLYSNSLVLVGVLSSGAWAGVLMGGEEYFVRNFELYRLLH